MAAGEEKGSTGRGERPRLRGHGRSARPGLHPLGEAAAGRRQRRQNRRRGERAGDGDGGRHRRPIPLIRGSRKKGAEAPSFSPRRAA